MRVFVTGAVGFAGSWLQEELAAHHHIVVAAPPPDVLDVGDIRGLARWFDDPQGSPDAVVHLAGMAFALDARTDPSEAFRVNVGGTQAVFEALRELGIKPVVLVAGSAEVYAAPKPEDLPLTEQATLAPRQPYALSKLAQEAVACEAALVHGFRVVVVRPFNHIGPRQRDVFVVPAMARRVVALQRGETVSIRVGNLDVKRDLLDVRDVVRAYRLLVESATSSTGSHFGIFNISSGKAVSIRSVIEQLCLMAGVKPVISVDPTLVRENDPPEIRGDSTLLTQLTGWRAEIPLDQTLAEVLAEAQAYP
jgi:GDP-4-dehydro-6-deoxy-D-mannose reductase